jgi:hypothetical protein
LWRRPRIHSFATARRCSALDGLGCPNLPYGQQRKRYPVDGTQVSSAEYYDDFKELISDVSPSPLSPVGERSAVFGRPAEAMQADGYHQDRSAASEAPGTIGVCIAAQRSTTGPLPYPVLVLEVPDERNDDLWGKGPRLPSRSIQCSKPEIVKLCSGCEGTFPSMVTGGSHIHKVTCSRSNTRGVDFASTISCQGLTGMRRCLLVPASRQCNITDAAARMKIAMGHMLTAPLRLSDQHPEPDTVYIEAFEARGEISIVRPTSSVFRLNQQPSLALPRTTTASPTSSLSGSRALGLHVEAEYLLIGGWTSGQKCWGEVISRFQSPRSSGSACAAVVAPAGITTDRRSARLRAERRQERC